MDDARARLLAERADAQRRLGDLGRQFTDIVEAAKDSNLDDEHDPEGSTIGAERTMVSALADSARTRIAEIDAALTRLDDGTYGVCTGCGEPIPPARLRARPAAATCVACAGRN